MLALYYLADCSDNYQTDSAVVFGSSLAPAAVAPSLRPPPLPLQPHFPPKQLVFFASDPKANSATCSRVLRSSSSNGACVSSGISIHIILPLINGVHLHVVAHISNQCILYNCRAISFQSYVYLRQNVHTLMSYCSTVIIPNIHDVSMPAVRLSVRPSVRLSSVRPSVRLSVHCPSVRPSFVRPSIRPSVRRLSVRPSVRPSARSFVRPYVRPSVHPSVRPYIHPSVLPSVRPYIHPSVRSSVHPSVRSSPVALAPYTLLTLI